MADMGDKARDEFFSEAHEIIEGLSRDLLHLDDGRGKGPADPELVNNVFRAVHTLKGLAGLFGAARMSALSHELENVLDDLRLGKIELTQHVVDLLFRGISIYQRIGEHILPYDRSKNSCTEILLKPAQLVDRVVEDFDLSAHGNSSPRSELSHRSRSKNHNLRGRNAGNATKQNTTSEIRVA